MAAQLDHPGLLLRTKLGPSRLSAAVALHGETFKEVSLFNWVLYGMSASRRAKVIPRLMAILLKSAALNKGIFEEVWTDSTPLPHETMNEEGTRNSTNSTAPACSAVWIPPGYRADNWRTHLASGFIGMLWMIGVGGCWRLLYEFQGKVNASKAKGLARADGKLEECYYLYAMSTKISERRKGLGALLVKQFQDDIRNEGQPIWLECTSEKSFRLYEKMGFETVDTWLHGVGIVDVEGAPRQGGEGLRVWTMIWRPGGEKYQLS